MNKIPNKLKWSLSYLVILLLLSACGNKGPLYLPDAQQSTLDKPSTTHL